MQTPPNKRPLTKNRHGSIKTTLSALTLFAYDSWSRPSGPDNPAGRHTAERRGCSDPSRTGSAPDDTCATLEESRAVKRGARSRRRVFRRKRVGVCAAHRSRVRRTDPHSRCRGHTPSCQGCTARCHIETHSRSRAAALSAAIDTRKGRTKSRMNKCACIVWDIFQKLSVTQMKDRARVKNTYSCWFCRGSSCKKYFEYDTDGSFFHPSCRHSRRCHHTAIGWERSGGFHIGNLPEDRRSPPLLEDKVRHGHSKLNM